MSRHSMVTNGAAWNGTAPRSKFPWPLVGAYIGIALLLFGAPLLKAVGAPV